MALPLFCHCFGDDLGLEALLGIHLLESAVFVLQLLEASHEGGIHPAKFGTPFVEGCRADAMLATDSGTGDPASACLRMAMIWLSLKRDVFM